MRRQCSNRDKIPNPSYFSHFSLLFGLSIRSRCLFPLCELISTAANVSEEMESANIKTTTQQPFKNLHGLKLSKTRGARKRGVKVENWK